MTMPVQGGRDALARPCLDCSGRWRSPRCLTAFRSTFRDWATEETNHPREVVEAALAHMVQNKVEAAYARSDLFEGRRLMDDWSAYVAGSAGNTG